MLAATLLAIFIVPVLYVVIQTLSERRRPALGSEPSPAASGVSQ
jgi:hypothetical protein